MSVVHSAVRRLGRAGAGHAPPRPQGEQPALPSGGADRAADDVLNRVGAGRCAPHPRIPGTTMHGGSSHGVRATGGLRVRIDKDLVAASATPLVLAILAEDESYGYAVLKRVR